MIIVRGKNVNGSIVKYNLIIVEDCHELYDQRWRQNWASHLH